MTVRRLARRILLGVLVSTAAPTWAAAQVFVSPALEAAAGYVSNRTLEPKGDGSAFYRLAPSLELTVFGPRDAEVGLSLRHVRTEFARSDAGWRDESSAQATVSGRSGRLGASLGAAAGLYRDEALPDDDSRWASVTPSLTWRADEAWSLSVSGSATATRYDSLETPDGDGQADTRWRLVPGVLWAPREGVRLWLELEGELNRSNASEEEYGALGAGLGLDAEVLDAGRVGAWARSGVREYREDLDGQSRRDTPVSAGLWGAYRLTSWAELTLAATRVDYRSTEDASDYEAWTVEGGFRFVYDHQLRGSAADP